MAKIRILNASPELHSVDVQVDGARAFSWVSYGQLTDYAPVPKGELKLSFYPAGGGEGGPLLMTTISLRADSEYTVAFVRKMNDFDFMLINDDTPPASRGRARLRLINLAENGRPVDLVVRGGPDVFRNVGDRELTGYVEVEPDTVDLEFKHPGEEEPFEVLDGVEIRPGGRYTLFVFTQRGGPPSLKVLPVTDRGPSLRL